MLSVLPRPFAGVIRYTRVLASFAVALCVVVNAVRSSGDESQNVLLVTIDGLRWQELFSGADQRLIGADGAVANVAATQKRFFRDDRNDRRESLMPFFWTVIANQGVIYGDPDSKSAARVSNSQHFSYPGYSELLCGFADPKIDSNNKNYNSNVTVLEWLNQQPEFQGRVAAICTWDVFPYIINDRRSGVLVNAGWQPTADLISQDAVDLADARNELLAIDSLAAEFPRQWEEVRYDFIAYRAADTYLRAAKPRVLYVSFGEVDNWAHAGRYDLYLDAIQRSDRYVQALWNTMQSMSEYKDKTTLLLTTDHGRGDGRVDWRSHNSSIPGCDVIWAAALGPRVTRENAGEVTITQGQMAASVAAILGLDFAETDKRIAPPFPCIRVTGKEQTQ